MSVSSGTRGPLVACDLDRTIIYSAGAMLLTGRDAEAPRLVVSEVYDAKPLSFMTRAAEDLLAVLAGSADFVPVTTRTQSQFARIRLPVAGDGYAVTTNGAVLLHRGVADPDWTRQVRERIDTGSVPLAKMREFLAREPAVPGLLRLRTAEDLFCYAIVDRAELPPSFLAELTQWCRAAGWTASLQGRKLYCLPAALTKEAAVAEIVRRTGARPLMAAGDSLLDRGLLELADIAVRPAHGELADAGYRPAGLHITAAAGVLAGEEVLRMMLGFVGDRRSGDCHIGDCRSGDHAANRAAAAADSAP